MTPRWEGKIVSGRPILDDPDMFKKYCLSLEGNSVFVTVEKMKNIRSNAQNRYLWGVLYKLISDSLGWEIEDVHTFCKQEFNPKHIELKGEEWKVGGSTTKMSTIEFSEYVEKIQRFFAEHANLSLPDPNQADFLEEPA